MAVELYAKCVELSGIVRSTERELRETALELVKICKHEEKEWAEYIPRQFAAATPPMIMCSICKMEWHTWNGSHETAMGKPAVLREKLYAERWPVYLPELTVTNR